MKWLAFLKETYCILNDTKGLNEDFILLYFNITNSKYSFAYKENGNNKPQKELKDISRE